MITWAVMALVGGRVEFHCRISTSVITILTYQSFSLHFFPYSVTCWVCFKRHLTFSFLLNDHTLENLRWQHLHGYWGIIKKLPSLWKFRITNMSFTHSLTCAKLIKHPSLGSCGQQLQKMTSLFEKYRSIIQCSLQPQFLTQLCEILTVVGALYCFWVFAKALETLSWITNGVGDSCLFGYCRNIFKHI